MSAIKSWQNRNVSHSQQINPFDETNQLKLEQSVLSPNLFQVSSSHSSEKETSSCIWNIDQRAVLYPADIPTDEKSLISQYLYDYKHTKQISAAVESFWSKNCTVIESPATNAVIAMRARMNKICKSNLSSPYQTTIVEKITKERVFLLHPDFDYEMNEFDSIAQKESPSKELNNSMIRKKLFHQNNEDNMNYYESPKKVSMLSSPCTKTNNHRRDSVGYQDHYFPSPKHKFQLDNMDVVSTPEISPNINFKNKNNKFKFQHHHLTNSSSSNRSTSHTIYSPSHRIITATTTTTTTTNMHIVDSDELLLPHSPNLSPIKEKENLIVDIEMS